MKDLIPYCTECDFINDTDHPCYNCGGTVIELREAEVL